MKLRAILLSSNMGIAPPSTPRSIPRRFSRAICFISTCKSMLWIVMNVLPVLSCRDTRGNKVAITCSSVLSRVIKFTNTVSYMVLVLIELNPYFKRFLQSNIKYLTLVRQQQSLRIQVISSAGADKYPPARGFEPGFRICFFR